MPSPPPETKLVTDAGRLYVSADERRRFIAAARDYKRTDVATFAATLAYTGCRISEALAVRANDVDLDEHTVRFRTLKRRLEHWRQVPVPDAHVRELELVHQLRALQNTRRSNRPLWPMGRSTASRHINRLMQRAGIDGPQGQRQRPAPRVGHRCPRERCPALDHRRRPRTRQPEHHHPLRPSDRARGPRAGLTPLERFVTFNTRPFVMPKPRASSTYEELSADLHLYRTTSPLTLLQRIEHLSALDPDSTITIQTLHLHELLRAILRAVECLSERDQLIVPPIDFDTHDSVNASTFGRLSIILQNQLDHACQLVSSRALADATVEANANREAPGPVSLLRPRAKQREVPSRE